jgi:thioredoxin reductase
MGFSAGIGGRDCLNSLKQQALKYGAEIRHAHVSSLTIKDDVFELRTDETTLYSHYVLLGSRSLRNRRRGSRPESSDCRRRGKCHCGNRHP